MNEPIAPIVAELRIIVTSPTSNIHIILVVPVIAVAITLIVTSVIRILFLCDIASGVAQKYCSLTPAQIPIVDIAASSEERNVACLDWLVSLI